MLPKPACCSSSHLSFLASKCPKVRSVQWEWKGVIIGVAVGHRRNLFRADHRLLDASDGLPGWTTCVCLRPLALHQQRESSWSPPCSTTIQPSTAKVEYNQQHFPPIPLPITPALSTWTAPPVLPATPATASFLLESTNLFLISPARL